MRRKVLHDGNSLNKVYYMSILHFNNATKIWILHVLIRFVFTSIMNLAKLR